MTQKKPRTHSKATRAKMSASHTGKKHSEGTKQKIRQAMLERAELVRLGLLPPFRHSPETIKLLKRKAKHRKVTDKARKASAMKRGAESLDKKVKHQIEKGKL